ETCLVRSPRRTTNCILPDKKEALVIEGLSEEERRKISPSRSLRSNTTSSNGPPEISKLRPIRFCWRYACHESNKRIRCWCSSRQNKHKANPSSKMTANLLPQ